MATPSPASPGSAVTSVRPADDSPATLYGMHHVAWVTDDIEKTIDFYTRVMRLPLVNVVADDQIPSTGEPFPYIHIFFRLGDGSTLAFFEAPGIPPIPRYEHPAHVTFTHIALGVNTRADVLEWARWLRQNGVEVIEHDHGIIHSLYFFDPNGIRLELTTTIDETWNAQEDSARRAAQRWIDTKRDAQARGEDVIAALRALAPPRRPEVRGV